MKIIIILIGVASVLAALVGSEYLMKLAKKKVKKDSEKQKKAIDGEIDVYQDSKDYIKKVKEKIDNIN